MLKQRAMVFLALLSAAAPSLAAVEISGVIPGCVSCHKPGSKDSPLLEGMPKKYFFDQIVAYKTGIRRHIAMRASVQRLSRKQVEALAEHFASASICPPELDPVAPGDVSPAAKPAGHAPAVQTNLQTSASADAGSSATEQNGVTQASPASPRPEEGQVASQ